MQVTTDAAGHDDNVWITTLAQVLKLTPGESPFFADYGIPAQQSIVQQVMPDFFVSLTQTQFASRFASLIMTKVASSPPTYKINVVRNDGSKLIAEIAT